MPPKHSHTSKHDSVNSIKLSVNREIYLEFHRKNVNWLAIIRLNQFVGRCNDTSCVFVSDWQAISQAYSHFCLLEVCNINKVMACLIRFHFLVFPAGSPLCVVLVSAADSAFFRMQFVDYWPVSANDSQTFTAAKVHLLVLCKSGAIHTVTTGRGTQSCTMQLTERSV